MFRTKPDSASTERLWIMDELVARRQELSRLKHQHAEELSEFADKIAAVESRIENLEYRYDTIEEGEVCVCETCGHYDPEEHGTCYECGKHACSWCGRYILDEGWQCQDCRP